jgi:acetate kinase
MRHGSHILTVNAGSTSVRLALFEAADTDRDAGPRALARQKLTARPGKEAADLEGFLTGAGQAPSLVVHRVVHGGPHLRDARLFDDQARTAIEGMIPLAPLHNPPTLAWAATTAQRLPAATALAVFDTGFFKNLPEAAATYALPRELGQGLGIRRLGFHGLAHASMWRAFFALRPPRHRRVISLQLGGGCSATALREGQPVETSMGFSPLEGLVMATRAGDLDAGALLHIMEQQRLAPAQMRALLYQRSGLAGLASGSGDVRPLLASNAPEAELALEVYCHRIRKYLGAYLAVLGGCDAVLIGGGAGEGAPVLRERIFDGLGALGLALDAGANRSAQAPARISVPGNAIDIWVIPTDEEQILAEEGVNWWRAREAPAPDLQP